MTLIIKTIIVTSSGVNSSAASISLLVRVPSPFTSILMNALWTWVRWGKSCVAHSLNGALWMYTVYLLYTRCMTLICTFKPRWTNALQLFGSSVSGLSWSFGRREWRRILKNCQHKILHQLYYMSYSPMSAQNTKMMLTIMNISIAVSPSALLGEQ